MDVKNDLKTRDELQRRLRAVERIARAMDDAIRVPGTNIRIGWDALIGLVPGLGDAITLLPQAYLFWHAYRIGVRKRVHAKMLINATVDLLVGVIPVVGDIADVFWKANRKNADLIRREIE